MSVSSEGFFKKHLTNVAEWQKMGEAGIFSLDSHLELINGEIVEMAPIGSGKLGVIEPGAYADVIIVDGNPFEDLSVLGTSDKWFDSPGVPESPKTIRVIMKNGKMYKNTL